MSKKKKTLFDKITVREVGSPSSSIDEALEEADKDKVREFKRKRLDKVILESEADILEKRVKVKELRKKLGEGESESEAPMTTKALVGTLIQGGSDPKVVSEWLKGLDPQALGALIALQSNNPALAAMAFGMGQRGQQLTTKDVIELNKAMREGGAGQPQITIDLAELIKAVRETPGEKVSPKEIVDSTIAAIQTGISLAAGGKKEENWFDKLMSTPEGVQTAKDIGLFGGSPEYMRLMQEIKDADRRFMKDMKTSDRQWQLRLMQYRDESRRAWAETQEKRRRTQLAEKALRRVGGAVARAVSEAEEEEEFEEEAKPARKRSRRVKQYECEVCGEPISVPPGLKPGATVTCASCGAIYEAEKTEEAKG